MRRTLGAWTALVLLALYAPIAVMVLFSFNQSKYSVQWTGFTLSWYAELARDSRIYGELANTLLIAAGSTLIATVLGTLAALAARRAFPGRRLYATLLSLPVMVPDIVLAIAILALFNLLAVPLSLGTAIVAHTTFSLSYVAIVVSARLAGIDPALALAAQDLGATPWTAFWRVTFPAILPGVLSGAILAFTLSLDDFVITYFTTGPGDGTLPVRIYSMVRFAVTPEINAVSTLILGASLLLIVASLRLSRVPVAGGGR